MSEHDEIRKGVAEAYAKALTQPDGGCCSPAPVQIKGGVCCGAAPDEGSGCCSPAPAESSGCCAPTVGPEAQGIIAQLAGYGADDLSALPDDAVTNSFGCGNPLAFSEVKAGDVRGNLSRAARSFIDAYAPQTLLVVNTATAPDRGHGNTTIRFIHPIDLAEHLRSFLSAV